MIRLGKSLNRICAWVIDRANIPALRLYVIETLCYLELCFPPLFFDIMEHSLIHLVDDLEMCGPVGGRWMYPCERYLGTLKSYVQNKAHLEASIANGYVAEVALGFCTEYLNLREHTKRQVWESTKELSSRGSVVEGRGHVFNYSAAELRRAHEYVIMQHASMEDMRR